MVERFFGAVVIDEIVCFGNSGAYLQYDVEEDEYFLGLAPVSDDYDFDDEKNVSAILLSVAIYLNGPLNKNKPFVVSGIASDRLDNIFSNLLDQNIYSSEEKGTDCWLFEIDFINLLNDPHTISILNFNALNLIPKENIGNLN